MTVDPAYAVTYDRYGYCGDNPANLTDATGMTHWWRSAFDWANLHLNPGYLVVSGWVSYYEACENHCSFGTKAKALGTATAGMFGCGVLALPFANAAGDAWAARAAGSVEDAGAATAGEGAGGASAVDANKLNHIFGNPGHNLGPLEEAFGGSQEDAYRAVDAAVRQV